MSHLPALLTRPGNWGTVSTLCARAGIVCLVVGCLTRSFPLAVIGFCLLAPHLLTALFLVLALPFLFRLVALDDWIGFPEPALALAAAPPGSPGLFRRRWQSPNGAFTAVLVVEPDGPNRDVVRVNFQHGLEPATSLAGRTVWLAGTRGEVDPNGNADFSRKGLLQARAARRRLDLRVGERQEAWQVVEEV